MGEIKWYKRDPRAALAGMMVLNLEERGAYNTILDLIYMHDGALDDDARMISAWLRVDLRIWARLRLRLLECGKLYLHGGKLRNKRADDEVLDALHRVASSAKAGLASAASRKQTIEILKGVPNGRSTGVELPTPTTTPTNLSYLVPKGKK